MLERLDDVPWEKLTHAYGSAGDVPGLIRSLSQPGAQQEEALSELFGNIWHQGTVYQASSYAIPFLIELATDPNVTRRDEILGLIGSLATGNSYLAVHARDASEKDNFWRNQPDFEIRRERERQNVNRVRIDVFEKRHQVVSLLDDSNPMIRCAAVYVLSRFPEHISTVGPFIRRAAQNEADPLSAAGMLWCLGYAYDSSSEAVNLLYLIPKDFADPRPSFASAIALRRMRVRLDGAAISVLRHLAASTWFADSCLSGVPWDFTGEIPMESILADIEEDADGAITMLMTLLREVNLEGYGGIVHDLLHLNFPNGNWRGSKRLTLKQETALRHIVDTDAVWNDSRSRWFLLPNGAKNLLKDSAFDLQKVRNEMRKICG